MKAKSVHSEPLGRSRDLINAILKGTEQLKSVNPVVSTDTVCWCPHGYGIGNCVKCNSKVKEDKPC